MSKYDHLLNLKLIGTARRQLPDKVYIFPQYILRTGKLEPIQKVEELFPPYGCLEVGNLQNGYIAVSGVAQIRIKRIPEAQGQPVKWALDEHISVYPIPGGMYMCHPCTSKKALSGQTGYVGPVNINKIPFNCWTRHILLFHPDENKLGGPFNIEAYKESPHTFLRLKPCCNGDTGTYTMEDIYPLKSPATHDKAPKNFPYPIVLRKNIEMGKEAEDEISDGDEPAPARPVVISDDDNQRSIVEYITSAVPPACRACLFTSPAIHGLPTDNIADSQTNHYLQTLGLRISLEANRLYQMLHTAVETATHTTTPTVSLWRPVLIDDIQPIFLRELDSLVAYAENIAAPAGETKKVKQAAVKALLQDRLERIGSLEKLLDASELLLCKDLPEMYEHYCLIRLVQGLLQHGYEADAGTNLRFDYGKEDSHPSKGSSRAANTLYFSKGAIHITLYREPVIYDDCTRNDLNLFCREKKPSGCAPDFVLKISRGANKREDYIILDAKFATPANIEQHYLPEVLDKYFIRLAPQRKVDRIAMVWTFQGRMSANAGTGGPTPSPMEEKSDGIPSFGNCIVNEANRTAMDSFWHTFSRLAQA